MMERIFQQQDKANNMGYRLGSSCIDGYCTWQYVFVSFGHYFVFPASLGIILGDIIIPRIGKDGRHWEVSQMMRSGIFSKPYLITGGLINTKDVHQIHVLVMGIQKW